MRAILFFVIASSLVACGPMPLPPSGDAGPVGDAAPSSCPETMRTYDERAAELGCPDAWIACPVGTLNAVSCVSQIHSAMTCADLDRVARFCAGM